MTPNERFEVACTVGTGHCGSTMLALFLDAHPEVASIGECSLSRGARRRYADGYPCSCRAMLRECGFWRRVFRQVNEQGYPLSENNWINDYRYEHDLVNASLGIYSSNPLARGVQRLAGWIPVGRSRVSRINGANVALVRAVLGITGKRVFFDSCKSLMRQSHLRSIPQFKVRFVRVVRDVRAYVNSYRRMNVPVAAAARQWLRYQQRADHLLRDVPPERVCVLKYEELCREPVESFRRLHQFLGVDPIEPPSTVVPREHHVIGNRIRLADNITIRLNDTWREALSNEERRLVIRMAGETNERFGYTA